MNYGDIIRDAFRISWRNKFLWFFRFFAAEVMALLGKRREALSNLRIAVENGFFNLPLIEYMGRSMIGPMFFFKPVSGSFAQMASMSLKPCPFATPLTALSKRGSKFGVIAKTGNQNRPYCGH